MSLARISFRTSWLLLNWICNSLRFLFFSCPFDVVDKRHEDDSLSKLFGFNVPFLQIILDRQENLQ